MRVYSQSQGRVIDIPDQTSTQQVQPSQSNQGGDMNSLLRQALLIKALQDPKNVSKYSALSGMIQQQEPSASEITENKKKENTEQLISQLEDYYFGNKLYKGNTAQGAYLQSPLLPIIDPNNAYLTYKSNLESIRPQLAKAAGDSGNIALAEQIQSGKPFPTSRFNKKSAERNFKEIRKKFGLEERNYDNIGNLENTIENIGRKYGL